MFSGTVCLQLCLMTSSERQVVLALEALADLGDVQLRAVFRVVAVKGLQEPLCLLIDLLCAARGVLASAACRFDRRMHPSEIDLPYF